MEGFDSEKLKIVDTIQPVDKGRYQGMPMPWQTDIAVDDAIFSDL
jgi:hypothetical protein